MGASSADLFLPDGTHLNEEGHRHVHRQLIRLFRKRRMYVLSSKASIRGAGTAAGPAGPAGPAVAVEATASAISASSSRDVWMRSGVECLVGAELDPLVTSSMRFRRVDWSGEGMTPKVSSGERCCEDGLARSSPLAKQNSLLDPSRPRSTRPHAHLDPHPHLHHHPIPIPIPSHQVGWEAVEPGAELQLCLRLPERPVFAGRNGEYRLAVGLQSR